MTTTTLAAKSPEQTEISDYLERIGSLPIPTRSEITTIAAQMVAARREFRRTILHSDRVLYECLSFLIKVQDKKIRYDRAFDVYHRNGQQMDKIRESIAGIILELKIAFGPESTRQCTLGSTPGAVNSNSGDAARQRLIDVVESIAIRIKHVDQWFEDFERTHTRMRAPDAPFATHTTESTEQESLKYQIDTEICERAKIYRNLYRSAKQRLAQSGLRLVVSIAKRYSGQSLSLMDLIQEGNSGLMIASEKFDPSLGFAFSTYATTWIQQSISFAVYEKSRIVRLPIGLSKKLLSARHQLEALSQRKLRSPSPEEERPVVSSCRHVNRWFYNFQKGFVSIDHVRLNDDARPIDFEDGSAEPPITTLHRELVISEIKRAVGILDDRRRMIVELRFGLNGDICSRRVIGEQLGISHERVRQLEVESLESLKSELRRLQPC